MKLHILCYSFLLPMILLSCQQTNHKVSGALISLDGKTMGTTYHIKYLDKEQRRFQNETDSILVEINNEVSTYIESSSISQFNKAAESIDISDKIHFQKNVDISRSLFELTDGYFDPTVMPLVNYWGFGYKGKKALETIDSNRIESIMSTIGMDMVEIFLDDSKIILLKKDPAVELDFSAVAKGYAVDIIGKYLESKNIENYLVEIGGENLAKGISEKNIPWVVGINTPTEGASISDMILAVSLKNRSMATSGDYRQVYEIDGKKYSHEIDPKIGYPKTSSLVSVSVIAEDCATADALATALIVMGLKKSQELIEEIPNTEACFLVTDVDLGFKIIFSSGFKNYTI